jgi:hypothetical protein
LNVLFHEFGPISDIKVIQDRATNQSRGIFTVVPL